MIKKKNHKSLLRCYMSVWLCAWCGEVEDNHSWHHSQQLLRIKCSLLGLVLGREWVKSFFSYSLILLSGNSGGGRRCLVWLSFVLRILIANTMTGQEMEGIVISCGHLISCNRAQRATNGYTRSTGTLSASAQCTRVAEFWPGLSISPWQTKHISIDD